MTQVKIVTRGPKRKGQGHGLTLQIVKKKISRGERRKINKQMHHQLHHSRLNSLRNQKEKIAKMIVFLSIKNLR